MRDIIHQFGRLRLFALALTFLPLAAIPLAGVAWLWQTGNLGNWLLLLAGCGGVSYCLHWWLSRRDRRTDAVAITRADSHWSATGAGAWVKVEELASQVDPTQYSLANGAAIWELAQETLERVAGHFHPEKNQPILELTVPHTLLIVERASRELRNQIVHSLPFSHRLTLGNLARARRWQQTAQRYHKAYRVGRAIVSPATAIYKEFSRAVGGQIMDYGGVRLQRWLLQEYVRKVGFYAIELYSGNLLLGGGWLPKDDGDPMLMLVLGRAGTGKSSLIQSLAGGAAEFSPDEGGKQLEAYRLSSPEWGELLLWDTPAWESLSRNRAKDAVTRADLIVWVSHAGNLDAAYEAGQLRRLKRWLTARSGQPEPPLLVALTHSETVAEAELQHSAAKKLGVDPQSVIIISLADPLHIHATEQLQNAISLHHPQASRSQYWRHLYRQRQKENREFTGQQIRNASGSAWRMVKGAFSRKSRDTPKGTPKN